MSDQETGDVVEPRADSGLPQPIRVLGGLSRLDSSIVNQLSGLGGSNDIGAAATPNMYRRDLAYHQLRKLYRTNHYAKRVIDLPAGDATRKGWRVRDGSDDPNPLKSEFRRLKVFSRFREALKWGALYGGAVAWLVVDEDIPREYRDDPTRVLATPLDLARVRSVRNIVVCDRVEAEPFRFERSPLSPTFREPSLWHISPGAQGQGVTVHASRVLFFRGAGLSASERYDNGGWDMSVIEAGRDAIFNKSSIDSAGATLAQRINVALMKIEGLGDIQVSDQKDYFQQRLELIAIMRSISNMIIVGDGETYDQRHANITGWDALSTDAKEALSCAYGIPLSIFFGQSPTGFSTDNKSDRDTWSKRIGADQTDLIYDNAARLVEVLYAAADGPTGGVVPDDFEIVFNPLDEPTREENAAIEKTHAETDEIRIRSGVTDARHVALSRHGENGYSDSLNPVDPADYDEPDEADLAKQIAAAVAERMKTEQAPGDDEDPAASPKPGEPAAPPAKEPPTKTRDAEARALIAFLLDEPAQAQARAFAGAAELAFEAGTFERETGDLPAHVTLLYLGHVAAERIPALAARAAVAVSDFGPTVLRGLGLDCFEPTESSEGRAPVIVSVDLTEQLRDLRIRLLTALAHFVSAEQHVEYKPHITLGYSAGEVSDEARRALHVSDDGRSSWRVRSAALVLDGVIVADIPLTGWRRDGGSE